MDLSKLALLSTDALLKVQDAIKQVLDSRLDTTLRIGRLATFRGRNGDTITIRIVKINDKSVGGVEVSPKSGSKWRVGKDMLTVIPKKREAPLPVDLKAPHKPVTDEENVW